MPADDKIYNLVRTALEKDDWRITHDPYFIEYRDAKLYADLGAERIFAAERENNLIAVEIKSFLGHSLRNDMYHALGQYLSYLGYMEVVDPERKLYLAVSDEVYNDFFLRDSVQLLVRRFQVSVIVVSVNEEKIIQWIE